MTQNKTAARLAFGEIRRDALLGNVGEKDKWVVYGTAWYHVDAGRISLTEAVEALRPFAKELVVRQRRCDYLAMHQKDSEVQG